MTSYGNILKQADIFYNLTAQQLDLIAGLGVEKVFEVGEAIFHEGAHSDELYLILQGEVDIQVNPALVSEFPDEHRLAETIATLRRGQSFGEIALVDRGLRSATARAAQNNTHLLAFPRQELIQLCEDHPELGYRLMYNLAADLALKLRSTDMRLRQDLLSKSRPDNL